MLKLMRQKSYDMELRLPGVAEVLEIPVEGDNFETVAPSAALWWCKAGASHVEQARPATILNVG
eukprot:10914914-Lingulodinium_polyedra.AAC.1